MEVHWTEKCTLNTQRNMEYISVPGESCATFMCKQTFSSKVLPCKKATTTPRYRMIRNRTLCEAFKKAWSWIEPTTILKDWSATTSSRFICRAGLFWKQHERDALQVAKEGTPLNSTFRWIKDLAERSQVEPMGSGLGSDLASCTIAREHRTPVLRLWSLEPMHPTRCAKKNTLDWQR